MDVCGQVQRSGHRGRATEARVAGHCHVRYSYDSGEFSDECDLDIEKLADSYKVSWITNGKVRAVGVGMEVGNDLAVGWRRVTD